jgi:transcriptional regulator with XRE-family HTH domain
MKDKGSELPLKDLGEKLKNIRQSMHETVADVSGAVEIDEQLLQRIEQGSERPSEDILLLLINHFGLTDKVASTLWEMAGYDYMDEDDDQDHNHSGERLDPREAIQQGRSMVMIMAIDPRIIYSDGVHITANTSGVVLNFAQGVGTPQSITTARIGMSRDQAHALITTLQKTLDQTIPKHLPAGNQPKANHSKQKPSDQQNK